MFDIAFTVFLLICEANLNFPFSCKANCGVESPNILSINIFSSGLLLIKDLSSLLGIQFKDTSPEEAYIGQILIRKPWKMKAGTETRKKWNNFPLLI